MTANWDDAALRTGSSPAVLAGPALAAGAGGDLRGLSVLAGVGDELERLVTSSERGFTAFGERLERALRCAGRVSAGAAAALAAVDDATLGERLQAVHACVDETPAVLAESSARLERLLATVGESLGLLDELRFHERSFGRLVRTVRSLAVNARVESTRMGAAGRDFEQLSEAVRQLSVDIGTRSRKVAELAQRLAAEMRASGAAVRRVRDQRDAELERALAALREALGQLARHGAATRAAGAALHAAAAELNREVGTAVAATQFQDITRQRLEHVRDTLRASHEGIGGAAPLAGRQRAATVAGLQREQLRSAGRDFGRAMADVTEAAAWAGTLAREIGQTVERLGADATGGGPLVRVRAALDALAGGVRRSAAAGEQVSEGIAAAIGLAGEIAGQVSGIDAIGEHLRLIALNAIVHANASDTNGTERALAVIAREMGDQAAHARTLTRELSAHLRRVGESAEALDRGAEGFARGAREGADRIVRGLAPVVDALGEADEGFQRGLEAVRDVLEELSGAIGALDAGLAFHRTLQTAIDRAVARLEPVGGRGEPHTWSTEDESWLEGLGLSTRYTMTSQRAVHAAVVRGAEIARAPSATAGGPAGPDDDGLGGNVELF
jgi:hypothetical protein